MAKIITLPGTIKIRKEDTITYCRKIFKDSGYSEGEIVKVAESFCPRNSPEPNYREVWVNKNRRNISGTKNNGKKVLFIKEKFELARERYKPDRIKYLLVAEAPPPEDSNRFFYYLDVDRGDSLFLETMKVLYPTGYDTRTVRNKKAIYLERFRADGFYLIDATDIPMPNYSRAQKRKQFRTSLPELIEKIGLLSNKKVKIILISAPVYQECYEPLMMKGFNVINTEMIDFPGSGGQNKFRNKMRKVLGISGESNV